MHAASPSNLVVQCSRSRLAAVAVAFGACLVWSASAFAQPNDELRSDARRTVLTRASTISTSAVRVYGDDQPESFALELPPNLSVSKVLKPVVEMMVRRSAIFRRQCLRIATAPRLTVSIGSYHPLPSERARARTQFVRRDGALQAAIQIAPLEDEVELIAHEIEHVIEQLDGVDLPLHASLRGSAASKCEDGSFETVRAVRAGLAVAREVDGVR